MGRGVIVTIHDAMVLVHGAMVFHLGNYGPAPRCNGEVVLVQRCKHCNSRCKVCQTCSSIVIHQTVFIIGLLSAAVAVQCTVAQAFSKNHANTLKLTNLVSLWT